MLHAGQAQHTHACPTEHQAPETTNHNPHPTTTTISWPANLNISSLLVVVAEMLVVVDAASCVGGGDAHLYVAVVLVAVVV